MRQAFVWLFAVSTATAQVLPPPGQSPVEISGAASPPHVDSPFIKRFARDAWHIWTSPVHSGNYNARSAKYIVPFTLLSAGLIATDRQSSDLLPNTDDQRKWSGRLSQLGASYSLGGFTAGTWLIGKWTGNEHAQETGWLALQALAHTQIGVFAVKQATNRRRPSASSGDVGFWEGGDAFPSGHSASAFAVATVFAHEYNGHIAVPILAYGFAGAISASRVGAQRHSPSDVAVGATVGFLIGRFIFKRHHDPDRQPERPTR